MESHAHRTLGVIVGVPIGVTVSQSCNRNRQEHKCPEKDESSAAKKIAYGGHIFPEIVKLLQTIVNTFLERAECRLLRTRSGSPLQSELSIASPD
jgi:hypothetical protein